jgi:hypothetical protein
MGFWNAALAAGWRTIFYPSVGTALTTSCHWLHVVCPACQQMGETDLRKIDIHPNASIATVVRAMSCKRCSPHPPFARPLGATRWSWYTSDAQGAARNECAPVYWKNLRCLQDSGRLFNQTPGNAAIDGAGARMSGNWISDLTLLRRWRWKQQ